eukprot:3925001-Prymnesium_polylepis.1
MLASPPRNVCDPRPCVQELERRVPLERTAPHEGSQEPEAYLTKRVFVGLFALTPADADRFPREHECPRRGGECMFKYTGAAIDAVLPALGGVAAWRRRLALRAAQQASIERIFGPNWRERYWIGTARRDTSARLPWCTVSSL